MRCRDAKQPVGSAIRSRGRGFYRQGRDGFTLIEVLVAMTVLALFSAYLLRGVVGLRAQAGWVDTHAKDVAILESLLDEALARRTLRTEPVSGEREGRRWTVTAAAIDTPSGGSLAANPSDPPPERTWIAQRITVQVETEGRPLVAGTVHLVVAR